MLERWCVETIQAAARCLEVPDWMFDRASLRSAAQAESPRVDRLKELIVQANGTTIGAKIEARSHSLALEGVADAIPGPPSLCLAIQSVSTSLADAEVALAARGSAKESNASEYACSGPIARPWLAQDQGHRRQSRSIGGRCRYTLDLNEWWLRSVLARSERWRPTMSGASPATAGTSSNSLRCSVWSIAC